MIAPVDRTDEFCLAVKILATSTSSGNQIHRRARTDPTPNVDESALCKGPMTARESFTISSYELAQKITVMQVELEKNSRRYCDFSSRGWSNAARDELDATAASFLRTCMSQIDALKAASVDALEKSKSGTSTLAHRLGVIVILNERLREVSSAVERLRAARIQAAVSAFKDTSTASVRGAPPKRSGISAPPEFEDRAEAESAAAEIALHEQEFARENAGLVTELVERRERVREAERTMTELAGLNQLFASKVLEQAREVESLYDLAVEATTYVDRGNKELRKLKRKGPFVKYCIAFVIAILAFAVIFLDWMSQRRALIWIF